MATKDSTKDPKTKDMPQRHMQVLARARKNVEKGIKEQKHYADDAKKDLKICNNEGIWHPTILSKRNAAGKPSLNINLLIPYIRDIISEQRENRPHTKVKPLDRQASREGADIREGYLRNRKHECKADIAYDNAFGQQLRGGFGAFQVRAEYEGSEKETALNQTFVIKPLMDQLSAVFDSNAIEWHKNDGEWMALLTYFDKDTFERKWLGVTPENFSSEDFTWYPGKKDKKFLVAEYYEKEHSTKIYFQLSDGTVIDDGEVPQGIVKKVGSEWPNPGHTPGNPLSMETLRIVKKRKMDDYKIYRYLLCGHHVLEDRVEWPCKYWPVIPVPGDEIVIDGKMHYRSLIRFSIDALRAYCMSRSSEVEAVGMVHKSFVQGTAAMFESYEDQWDDLEGTYSRKNYNPDPMMPGQKPERLSSIDPSYIGALAQASAHAFEEVRQTIGPNLLLPRAAGGGLPDVSGRALGRWQAEGDMSTYLFVDNLQRSIEWGDLVCVELMKRLLDTNRVITVRKMDGSTETVEINKRDRDPATAQEVVINDMTVGAYGVETTMGPSYAAQRAELADLLVRFTDGMPQIKAGTADILAAMLFDMSQNVAGAHGGVLEEFVKRVKKLLLKDGTLTPDDLKPEELKEFAPLLLMLRNKPLPPQVAVKLKSEIAKAAKYFADAQKSLAASGQIRQETAMGLMNILWQAGQMAAMPVQQPQAQLQGQSPQQGPMPQGTPMQ